MNRPYFVLAACLAWDVTAFAQLNQTALGHNTVQFSGEEHSWHAGFIPPPRQEKDRPFSAAVTSQTVRQLPDGTYLRQSTAAIQYRDTQGRVRTETMSGGAAVSIVIRDPVAGVAYRLNPVAKTAAKETISSTGSGFGWRQSEHAPAQPASRGHHSNGTTEDLGSANIEGLITHGTRTTLIVPAGAIGNSAEFRSTEEHWFSPELNLIVRSISSDPRFGTTTYELTNLSRQPPASMLFQVPADFTMAANEGHDHGADYRTQFSTDRRLKK